MEQAEGVAPLGLDLADRFLIFLQALVDRIQKRFQILSRRLFALAKARVGAFEKRFLRAIEHHLPDLAKLRGERRLRILQPRNLRVMRFVARFLLAEQRGKPDVGGLARLGLGGKVGHRALEPFRKPVALGLERARLAAGEEPADQAANGKGNKGDDKRGSIHGGNIGRTTPVWLVGNSDHSR